MPSVRVLIINDYSSLVGGAERFLENLMSDKKAAEIDFVRIDINELFPQASTQRSNFFQKKYHRLFTNAYIIRTLVDRIRQIRPDVIHLNNNNLFTNSVVRSLRLVSIPVVYFIHDEYSLKRLRSVFFPFTNDRVTFITHAPDIYRQLIRIKRNVSLVKVPFNNRKWRQDKNVMDQSRVADLLYVGRIEKSKGIFTLMKAIEIIRTRIPSITLTVIGDGSRLKEVEDMIHAKGLQDNVKIMGKQQDPELMQYYRQAGILVFPSFTESLGYVGLEAQSSGIPVIAFINEGTARWCKDYHNGFIVRQRTPQKLAEKIMEIIHDDTLLKKMSDFAQEFVSYGKYNASNVEITDLYREIQ